LCKDYLQSIPLNANRTQRESRNDPHLQHLPRIGQRVRAHRFARWPRPAAAAAAAIQSTPVSDVHAAGQSVAVRLPGSGATGWRARIGADLPSSLSNRRGPDTARFRASSFSCHSFTSSDRAARTRFGPCECSLKIRDSQWFSFQPR